MVIIYAANISKLPDPKEMPELMKELPQTRQEKILRCMFAEKRKQNLGAGLLLEYVFKLYGKDSGEIQVGAHGKPELDNFFFNLSHAGDFVICAVSNQVIGCDIERVSKEPKNIAKRCFCENENRYLNLFYSDERTKEFFRLWTFKESYIKMTGEGMSLELNRVEFVPKDFVKVYRDGLLCSCMIKEYEVSGYQCSVCSEDAEFADDLQWIELEC